MPRSYIDVQAAKDALFNKKTESAIYQLPPGYIAGFQLEVTDTNQLTVGKGICNIHGKRVENNSIHIISGENFVDPDHILTVFTYYIYISSDGQFKVDVLEAEYDNDGYGFYHPVLKNYRYLGRFQIHTDGTYYNIFQQNPIVKGGISAAAIEALFLYALEAAIIGYKGTGINDSPSEGDRRTYIDNDEIGFQEYTGGEWVNRAKIGGAIAGLFLAWVGACGLYHPDNPPGATEFFPGVNYRIFNFENNYEDQNGIDDWSVKTNCDFSDTIYKFGIHSFFATEGDRAQLRGPSNGNVGESQTLGAWFFFSEEAGGDVDTYCNIMLLYGATPGSADAIVIDLYYDSDNTWHIRFRVMKSGATVFSYLFTSEITENEWNYIAFSYDKNEDILSCIVNNEKYISPVIGGAWDTPDTMYILVEARNSSVIGGTGPTISFYIDELIYYYDNFLNTDILVQHYNHNIAWSTTYAWADIPIRPYPGGRCYLDADTLITGQLAITGVSKARAYQSAAQTIATTTTTKVSLQTESYDNLSEFTGSRFTAKQAGDYIINGQIALGTPVAGRYINIYIYLNGAPIAINSSHTSTTTYCSASSSTMVTLAVGDYIELYIRHNCGGDELMIATSARTFLEVHRLS